MKRSSASTTAVAGRTACARLTRLVLSGAVVLLVGCDWTSYLERNFKRNPNLSLLWQSSDSSASAFNPVWSRDGSCVYFLLASGPVAPWPDERVQMKGSLWSVAADGSGARELLPGGFFALALSPDGNRLALVGGSQTDTYSLVVTDTAGTQTDTISPREYKVLDANFNGDGSAVYASVADVGFVRFDLPGLRLDTVFSGPDDAPPSFAVWGDSLIVSRKYVHDLILGTTDSFSLGYDPCFHPQDPSRIVSDNGYWNSDVDRPTVLLLNTSTRETRLLDAAPYAFSDVFQPNWSPDGLRVVLSACEVDRRSHNPPQRHYELWILNM